VPLKKYTNEKSLKEDFKYLKPILQMRIRPRLFLIKEQESTGNRKITSSEKMIGSKRNVIS